MSLQIVGLITLTSHAHQSDPDGRVGNRSGTMKTWHFSADGRRKQTPYITSNSVRGLTRRAGAEIVLTTLGKPVSRELFSILTRGAAGRSDISAEPTVDAMVFGGRNVFAGLFGGGPYMLHSRFSMGPLIPALAWTERYLHPALRDKAIPLEYLTYKVDDIVRDAPLTTDIILTGKDDLLMGRGQQYVENYQESLKNWLGHVSSGRAAKAAKKEADTQAKEARKKGDKPSAPEAPTAKSSDLQGFNFIEAMLPGTPLQFWLRLKPHATPAQVGLALMSVRDWANQNTVGGMSARGFGSFEASLSLYDSDTQVCENIFRSGDHATAYRLNPALDQYLTAATTELEALTVEDLELVYPSDPQKKAA